jgi:DNA-directed RNA polymerase subunit alpha
MTPSATAAELEKLLAGTLGRDEFRPLVECIYQSYAAVDRADEAVREMEGRLAGLSGEEERDLGEKVGIVHFARGNYEAAAERLRPLRARKTSAHFLGRTYLKLQRDRDAIEQLEHGRSGDDDPLTDMLLVEAYCNLREVEQAAKVLGRPARKDDPVQTLYARGRLADTVGEYGEAMEFYQAAIEKDTECAEALFRLGLACDLNGDDDRAIELYRRCASLTPASVGALINLGILYEDHDMYFEAVDCYRRVLAIDPRHEQARLYLKDAESSVNMRIDIAKSRASRQMEEVFNLPVSEFELSARSRNALDRMDIKTLGGLARVTREELLNERNFGDTSLEEVEGLLRRYDLGLGEGAEPEEEESEEESEHLREKLDLSIDALELSTRCRKCADRLGITTVGALAELTEEELLAVSNFGTTSLNEIRTKLAALGLSLRED